MTNPHKVTQDFEQAICEYTGAPFAVATTSCSMALLLAVAWHLSEMQRKIDDEDKANGSGIRRQALFPPIEIPKRTYLSVPMSIIHAGGRPTFRDEEWSGGYQLKPLDVWDCARIFTSGMYRGEPGPYWHTGGFRDRRGHMLCVSFHASKTLGIEQGGAILHDDPEADEWLRRARFDGRKSGVAPQDDKNIILGWHAYMNPSTAAALILKLYSLPKHNEPLPNDPYPDLSTLEVFK